MNKTMEYESLTELAKFLKGKLENKRYILLYGYNGVGKTRLSYEFKSLNQEINEHGEKISSDTLYYNAFTEDLFSWDNDIENDSIRKLMFNSHSKFFNIMKEGSIDGLIRKILHQFVNFDFTINYSESSITFNRTVYNTDKGINETLDDIKISRSEESLFILCFFLAIVDIVLKQNNEESKSYEWVKYIYIDDPVSSLDDNNIVIMMALLKDLINIRQDKIKFIITTHHSLFFNLLSNNFKDATNDKYFMMLKSNEYIIKNTNDIPSFYHISLIKMLKEAAKKNKLYDYHFHFLRILYEKIASFLGYENFTDCLEDGEDKEIYKSLLNVSSHGGYFIYEPEGMIEDNKKHFCNILNYMIKTYKFNEKGINCNKYNIRNRR